METIKGAIKNLMQKIEAGQHAAQEENKIEDFLKKAFTKKELNHIKFSYFKRGVLGISVDSSSWVYYLNLHKQRLLSRLCKKFDKVKDIRFVLGEIG